MTTRASENLIAPEIADMSPAMLWATGPDKLCNYVNAAWLEFTGRALEDELGFGWTDRIHPDDLQACFENYERSFNSREPFKMEYRFLRHDGVYRWVLDSGKPIFSSNNELRGYTGSCVDITDQKQSLLTLQNSEDRYRLVMDIINEGIWDVDFAANEHFISESYLSNLGYAGSDLGPDIIGATIELIHPDEREKIVDEINKSLQSVGSFDIEFRQLAKSGEYLWMRSRGKVLSRDESGNPIRVVGTHTNIDKGKRAEIALRESEKLLKRERDELQWIYTNAPIGLCMFDRKFRYQRINKLLADAVNRTIEDHLGKSIDEIIPGLAPEIRNEAQKVLLTGAPSMHNKITGPAPNTTGQNRTFLYSCYPISNAEHVVTGFGFVVQDITEQSHLENELKQLNLELEKKVEERTNELAEANAALKRLSRTDTLTGLNNRLAANEKFRIEHSRFKRTGDAYAVLVADIDLFKNINDKYGHSVGDDVLRLVSVIFATNLRAHDFVARHGGEEFIFLLPSTSLEQATIVAEKIRKAVADTPHPDAGTITVSIGVAEASPEQENEEQAIQVADRRLYEAKNGGRNRVVAF